MKRAIFFGLFLGSTLTLSPSIAGAKDCTKTCVEVRREGGELIITAKRDPIRRIVAPTPKPTPTPTPKPTPTPTSRASAPATTSKVLPKVAVRKVAPKVAPKIAVRVSEPQVSLSDQIRELLPTGTFTLLPRVGALIKEPVILRAQGCQETTKRLPILDTEIELRLRPRIQWNWGDGSSAYWPGGVTRGVYIYQRPGRYLIIMNCLWAGQYRTPDSPWEEIPSGITSTDFQIVELFRARVFFTE